ncbi:hypothetical protein [uncultured Tenacibaculum sp.]|uniref:hypothetical protein n=1 Tax=uncultured Tenacibaculum sp. TaxID=174713 RepID=UPI0026057AD6|nr:hypothetical protein [uncultured Tenacibaculum sp.]
MKKSILNLKGAKILSKQQLKSLNGGADCWYEWDYCSSGNSNWDYFNYCMRMVGCGGQLDEEQ